MKCYWNYNIKRHLHISEKKKILRKIKKKADCRPWHGYVRQSKEQQNLSDRLLFTVGNRIDFRLEKYTNYIQNTTISKYFIEISIQKILKAICQLVISKY